jgi:hypothetical protein
VIGPDPGGDRKFQVGCLADLLRGQVRGPERLGDGDVGTLEARARDRLRSSLSEVTISSCPRFKQGSQTGLAETPLTSSQGRKSGPDGVGVFWPSAYLVMTGRSSRAYSGGYPVVGSSYDTHRIPAFLGSRIRRQPEDSTNP